MPRHVDADDIAVEPTDCVVCGASEASAIARGKDYLHRTSDQEYVFVRCSRCGHVYLDPRPKMQAIARLYPPDYATYTKHYSQEQSLIAKVKEAVLVRRFASFARHPRKDLRLLDVGCGDAVFLTALRRRYPAAELAGLDWHFGPSVQDDMRAAKIMPIVGVIETADLSSDYYDVITMNQLIEHVWDVDLVLRQCWRALKPGGLLAIETPNPDGWDRALFRSGAWGAYYWPRHLNLFSMRNLRAVVERAGFRTVSWQPLLAPPCWIGSCHFAAKRMGAGPWVDRVFADNNVALLAGFAAVDLLAKAFGATTSNQKLVAEKVPTAERSPILADARGAAATDAPSLPNP
jgi:2-polyprenyl-3-methyl-5-hydroxy-6-metoxy-1,4-benzoquinol methylase